MAFKEDKMNNIHTTVPPIMPKTEVPMPHLIAPIKEGTTYNFNNQASSEKQVYSSFPAATRELSIGREQQNTEEPFFVRIDKFNSSKSNFVSIIKKMEELEDIISTIEKIKEKEDNELEEWKKQSELIKELLGEIDKEIFGKL